MSDIAAESTYPNMPLLPVVDEQLCTALNVELSAAPEVLVTYQKLVDASMEQNPLFLQLANRRGRERGLGTSGLIAAAYLGSAVYTLLHRQSVVNNLESELAGLPAGQALPRFEDTEFQPWSGHAWEDVARRNLSQHNEPLYNFIQFWHDNYPYTLPGRSRHDIEASTYYAYGTFTMMAYKRIMTD